MSYDEYDDYKENAMEAFCEQFSKEIYPEHKAQAIEEFTAERLSSFYKQNPSVMLPAICALREGYALRKKEHFAASVVFCASAIELFLKATLLKPIVYGLIYENELAETIVQLTLGQSGFERYKKLFANLFIHFADLDIEKITREGEETNLFAEWAEVQKHRNRILHQGEMADADAAKKASLIAHATYQKITEPLLNNLNLVVNEKGLIVFDE